MPAGQRDEYVHWAQELSLAEIQDEFHKRGCDTILVKRLANDNSKNQIYLGTELAEVSLIPSGDVAPFQGSSGKPRAGGPIYQASVDLFWLSPRGDSPAPHTKLIYYPQYPEVRLSGFLRNSPNPPRSLLVRELRGREAGRLLLLGIVPAGKVFGVVLPQEAKARDSILDRADEPYGVFFQWRQRGTHTANPRSALLDALCRISRAGWHHGQKLTKAGLSPYRARNAGGYTLEALLGVTANGAAEPDFAGWEVKSHSVGKDFNHPRYGPVTLMTPEPDGGLYSTHGVVDFMLKYGYASSRHASRRDYAGIQRHGDPLHPRAQTRLEVEGFDHVTGTLLTDGQVSLRGPGEELAASWSFSKLLNHWKAKHALAVYVPTIMKPAQDEDGFMYHYGSEVLLAEGTAFPHLLKALASGTVYYDPGTNMTMLANGVWKSHRRNQFRVKWQDLSVLYDQVEGSAVCL